MEEMREQGLKCKRHRGGPHEDRVWGPGVLVGRRMFRKGALRFHWQPGPTSGRDPINRRHGTGKPKAVFK